MTPAPHDHHVFMPPDPRTYAGITAELIRGDVRKGTAEPLSPRVRFREDLPGRDKWPLPQQLNELAAGDCSGIPRAAAPFTPGVTHVLVLETPSGYHAALFCEGLAPEARIVDGRFEVPPASLESIRDPSAGAGMNDGQLLSLDAYARGWLSRIWIDGVAPPWAATEGGRNMLDTSSISALITSGAQRAVDLALHLESLGEQGVAELLSAATPDEAASLAGLYAQGVAEDPDDDATDGDAGEDLGSALDPVTAWAQIIQQDPTAATTTFVQRGTPDPGGLFALFQRASQAQPAAFGSYLGQLRTIDPSIAGQLAALLRAGAQMPASSPLRLILSGGDMGADPTDSYRKAIGAPAAGADSDYCTYYLDDTPVQIRCNATREQLAASMAKHGPFGFIVTDEAVTQIWANMQAALHGGAKAAQPGSAAGRAQYAQAGASSARRRQDSARALRGDTPPHPGWRRDRRGHWWPPRSQQFVGHAPIPYWRRHRRDWAPPVRGEGNWYRGWSPNDRRRRDPATILALLQQQQGDPVVIFQQYTDDGGDLAALLTLMQQQDGIDADALAQFLAMIAASSEDIDGGSVEDIDGGFIDRTNGGGSIEDIDGYGPDLGAAPLGDLAAAGVDLEGFLGDDDDDDLDPLSMLAESGIAAPCTRCVG